MLQKIEITHIEKRVFTKSVINNSFERKYVDLDHTYSSETGRYIDDKTNLIFSIFLSGWMCKQDTTSNSVFIVGKKKEDSLELSTEPRVHLSYAKAKEQAAKLKKEHNADFLIFTSDSAREFRSAVRTKYQEWAEKKKANETRTF